MTQVYGSDPYSYDFRAALAAARARVRDGRADRTRHGLTRAPLGPPDARRVQTAAARQTGAS